MKNSLQELNHRYELAEIKTTNLKLALWRVCNLQEKKKESHKVWGWMKRETQRKGLQTLYYTSISVSSITAPNITSGEQQKKRGEKAEKKWRNNGWKHYKFNEKN